MYKGISALCWPSITNYHLLSPHSVLYWPSTEPYHLVTHSWANWTGSSFYNSRHYKHIQYSRVVEVSRGLRVLGMFYSLSQRSQSLMGFSGSRDVLLALLCFVTFTFKFKCAILRSISNVFIPTCKILWQGIIFFDFDGVWLLPLQYCQHIDNYLAIIFDNSWHIHAKNL